jgi:hypothetical protein
MSTPGSIIQITHDPDQPEDTPGESVSTVYQIDAQTTAKLSYDGTIISGTPRRYFIEIDLNGSRSMSAMNVIDKDIPPYHVTFNITGGLSDRNADLSVWMDEEHVRAVLAIAVKQVIEFQRLSVQGQQEPSGSSSQPTNRPSESPETSSGGSIGLSDIMSNLVTTLRGTSM